MPLHNEIIVNLRPISTNGVFDAVKLPIRAPFRGPVIRLGYDALKLAWSLACSGTPDSEWSTVPISKHKLVRRQEEIRTCQTLFDADTPAVIEYTYHYAGRDRTKLAVSRGACKLLADELAKDLAHDLISMRKQLEVFRAALGVVGEVEEVDVFQSELDIKLDRLRAIEASRKTA